MLWRTNISGFARVRYREVYPGIDLVYYGNEGQLEYGFVVAPGADPGRIELAIEGADSVEVDAQGNLRLEVAGQDMRTPLRLGRIRRLPRRVDGFPRLSGGEPSAGLHETSATVLRFGCVHRQDCRRATRAPCHQIIASVTR